MKTYFGLVFLLMTTLAFGKVVKYELTATKGKVNLSGKKEVDFALMLNGTIPAPTLEFTEGDEAEITVINKIPDDELSIHWHGLLLDPFMDGVPYVNTPPIRPGSSFTFKFKLRQNGTYWYHSHTNVQEQKGVYGAFIVHPKEKKFAYNKDLVVVISDWSDEDATQILRNLKKDGDYYLYKKDTMRSWWGALSSRPGSFKNFLRNEWTRMGGMDFSDVGYDAFLINGKKSSQGIVIHPGDKLRVRIINAAASSYFHVSLGNIPMRIVSMDGVDIEPVWSKEFLIGMAETYDLLFEAPEHKNYELRATAQDGTGHASTWIGMGEKVPAIDRPFPDMYASMDHGSHDQHGSQEPMDHSKMEHPAPAADHGDMDHSQHVMKPVTYAGKIFDTFDVTMAQAQQKTSFDGSIQVHDVKLVLDGDMERYVWHINGKAIHQDLSLTIQPNQVIRFTFVNNTMMHHPMHLHGHFFRVLNQHGEKSPMKHTVDVAPHTTRVIEFYSNEPGDWMLHCHNLYHLKTGMARVVKYSSFTPREEIRQLQPLDPHLHDHLYYRGRLEAATNHAQFDLDLMKTWDELELRTEWRNDFSWEGQGDLFYKRWLNKWLHLSAGGTMVRGESAVIAGAGYILPMLIESHLMVDQKGRLRADVEKRFQWTKHLYSDAEFTFRQKQESEFEVSLMYQRQWSWSAGLKFTEHSAGVGAVYNF